MYNVSGVLCPDGYSSWCKLCMRSYAKSRSYPRGNGAFKKKYGISYEERDVIFSSQGGCCKICNRELTLVGHKKNSAHMDHCHYSGKIRAILCNGCNTGIGMLGDDHVRVRAAADYLYFHASEHPDNFWEEDDGSSC